MGTDDDQDNDRDEDGLGAMHLFADGNTRCAAQHRLSLWISLSRSLSRSSSDLPEGTVNDARAVGRGLRTRPGDVERSTMRGGRAPASAEGYGRGKQPTPLLGKD